MKQRLVLFIQEQFPTDFNDFVESSLAIMLIENWAFLADTLSFKMDQIVNELFIDTVTEIDNAFRLSALVGFEPTPPIAASASFSVTLGSLLDVDMVIPTPVQVNVTATTTSLTFELFPADANGEPLYDDSIIVPAGSFSNTSVIGVEGVTRTEQFETNGQTNQSYLLSASPVIYDTVQVDINGVGWQEVDYFTDSQQRLEYRVAYDSTYQVYIIFGDNKAGAIPPNGAQLQVTYRVGGGAEGNIVTGAISTSIPYPVPGFEITIPVAITNYTAGQFGYDGDQIDDIRRKLPAYLRTQGRAVTGDDYATLANQFVTSTEGQVGKATAVLRNYGCAGNIIDLFILALNIPNSQSGTSNQLQIATDGLKSQLATYLENMKMMTDYVCIKDGEIVLVDVVITLTMDKFFKKFKDEIVANATNLINNFFALTNWDFGQNLRDIDIVKTLATIREITRTDVTFVTTDPSNSGGSVFASYYQIIQLDTVQIQLDYE
jgi:hypothetical protein